MPRVPTIPIWQASPQTHGRCTTLNTGSPWPASMTSNCACCPPHGPWEKSGAPSRLRRRQAGCLVVHPLYPAGVIDFRTVWLFSDVLFGVRSDGLLLFGPDPSEAVGWFLAAAGHVAVLAADDSGRTAHNGRPLSAGIPVILATGDTLLTDSLEWAVEIS